VTEVLEEGAPKNAKPRTGSLFKSMQLQTVSLDDALRLLSLPRLVGVEPATGEEITAQNGRYGPYLKKGTDSRSLTGEDQIFDVSLEEALAIYAQPKARGRQATPPLRELGADPVSGGAMVVKDGRFGPYVTDGTTNATLRKDDQVESITLERAAELLEEKRARGPAPRKTAKKAPAKRAPAKQATAGTASGTSAAGGKTTVKKAVTKKTVTKKTVMKNTAAKTAAVKKAAAPKTTAKKSAASKATASARSS